MEINSLDFVGGLLGALISEFVLTSIFSWLTNKIWPQGPARSRLVLSNILSLIIYTIAMGYSMVPDLTSGEPPHLLAAFARGLLPQMLIFIFGFVRAKGRPVAQGTAP